MKYIIGLDIGIGSVGWAVVRNDDDCKRLEDFGVRIFESGEIIESNKNNISVIRFLIFSSLLGFFCFIVLENNIKKPFIA